uniref:Uncharacterized protein n=1 Tax=viral metagenome TaxID=1070528 RepID=A0A6C0J5I6_9ZZZZ
MEPLSELNILSSVDKHITITVIGDTTKTILLQLWANNITEIPGAWSTIINDNIICLIWDIMLGSTVHMFPSSSVNHSIIVYDMPLRKTDQRALKYNIQDYLKHAVSMKGNLKNTSCIIIKGPDTGPGTKIGEIIRACKTQYVKTYIVNNSKSDISSLKYMIRDIATSCYSYRVNKCNNNLLKYLRT